MPGGNPNHDPKTGRFDFGHNNDPLGHGYSHEARLDHGVIHTSNVYDAVRALYEGRNVELDQPDEISVLVDKLGAISAKWVELGDKAPNFDLCKVTLAGTNLFCADSKGIPRIKMPQVQDRKGFLNWLEKKGYDVTKDRELASHMRATQSQLVGANVARIVNNRNKLGQKKIYDLQNDKRIVLSRDNYILDGHHHWAAAIARDAQDNHLGDFTMRVARVNIGITKLIKMADRYTGGRGKVGV